MQPKEASTLPLMGNKDKVKVAELAVEDIGDGQQVVYSEVAVYLDGGDQRIYLDLRERNPETKVYGEGLLLPFEVWDAIVQRVAKL